MCWATDAYFMKNAPVSRMKKEDFDIAIPVIRRALDEDQKGETYKWENPATGASGSVKPKPAFSRKGTTCRRAEFTTQAGGVRNVASWTLCKVADGWKVLE
jgi:surface antigen